MNPLDTSPLRWVILTVGVIMAAYAWQQRQPQGTSDFTILYNSAARPAAHMYDPQPRGRRGNLNPPHFQALLTPLTRAPLPAAAAIWRALNLIALAGCVLWIAWQSDEPWTVADVGAILAWSPMQSVLSLNQLTWILWPLLLISWSCWRRERWIAGAISFGIALSFKSFLGVFLVWLVLRRQWRAAVVSLVTCAAAFGAGIVIYGVDVFRAWLGSLVLIGWAPAVMNASWRGLFARLFEPNSTGLEPFAIHADVVGPLATIASGVIVVVTLLRTRDSTVEQSWPAVMAASLLASPLGWVYYFWWLLPGMRPSNLLFVSPPLWIPMVCVTWGQPSAWATITIGSMFFWGLLLAWRAFVRDGIRGVGPIDARQVVQRDAHAPSIR